MHSIHKDASIDSLRRNPTDGAYHCPRCDAPFTRRSNLRRHYHIREFVPLSPSGYLTECRPQTPEIWCTSVSTVVRALLRGALHLFHVVPPTSFRISSEELHSHSLQCGSAVAWDQSTDRMIQAMTQYTSDSGIGHNIEFTGGLGIVGTPIHEHPPGLSDDFINVDIFQQTDSLKAADQATHEFQDFFSSISSALSESASSPSTSSEILSASAVSFPFPFPTQTPGTGSAISSNVNSSKLRSIESLY
jgi:hypothetical protein